MTDKVRTIRLYGALSRFGRVHRFVCNDTAGAVRALCQMVPGFQQFLYESKENGLGYACFVGKENINEDALHAPVGNEDIRIAPIILGSGRGGFFQVILGVALIGASFIPGLNVAVWSGAGMTWAGAALGLGTAMVLGGVSSLLTRPPTGLASVSNDGNRPDNGASYFFNGPENVVAQGNPVPVLYGQAIVGSITVSADMFSENQQ